LLLYQLKKRMNMRSVFLANKYIPTLLSAGRDRVCAAKNGRAQLPVIPTGPACAHATGTENGSFETQKPVAVLSGLRDGKGYFSSKHVQSGLAGAGFHRRSHRFAPLREEYALCNPPFLEPGCRAGHLCAQVRVWQRFSAGRHPQA
jgi:hypothetical protein